MTAADITNIVSFTGAALVISMDVGVLALMGGTYMLAGHFRDGFHLNIASVWAVLVSAVAFWLAGAALQTAIGMLPAWAIGPFLNLVLAMAVVLLLAWVTCLAFFQEEWKQLMRRRKGRVGEGQVARAIKRAGYLALNDIYVRHGAEIVQIDHLVLAGSRLVVLETKNYGGDVFGHEADESWTLKNDDKETSPIKNPLRQNERQVRILNAAYGTNAEGWVVFARMTRLPKGLPDRTVEIADLARLLNHLSDKSPVEGPDHARAQGILDAIRATDQAALGTEHRKSWTNGSWKWRQAAAGSGEYQGKAPEAATAKQVEFGTEIAQALGIEAPVSADKATWGVFISANLAAYNASKQGRRWKGAA